MSWSNTNSASKTVLLQDVVPLSPLDSSKRVLPLPYLSPECVQSTVQILTVCASTRCSLNIFILPYPLSIKNEKSYYALVSTDYQSTKKHQIWMTNISTSEILYSLFFYRPAHIPFTVTEKTYTEIAVHIATISNITITNLYNHQR